MDREPPARLPVIGVRLADGRTGSTLLMQLLGTSPHVAFDRRYPAEYRFLSYFARMAEQMVEPFDERRHVGVTPFFFGPRPTWGPVPFASDVVDVGRLGAPLLRSMWSAWTEQVCAARPDTRWYAEKLAVPVEVIRAAGIDVRVIDLVRDPRDVLASIRAFTATGMDGFDRQAGQSESEYLDVFIAKFAAQLERMHDRAPDDDRIVVRYEDLVTDTHGQAQRIGGWLSLTFDASAVLGDRDRYRHHMTTSSVDASIGRWERDLEPTEARRIASALGALLVAFGYDLA
jgi:hypothetical protein